MPSHIPTTGPLPLERLTRPQVAARCYAVRGALDLLACQADADGAGLFRSVGPLKVELNALENRLRDLDRAAAVAIAEPSPRRRLSAATSALHGVLTDICADAIRAVTPAVEMPARLAGTSWQPTVRQVADYRALVGSPRFTAEERERAERWLEQSATVHTIPAQITWLREELARREPPAAVAAGGEG